MNSNNRTWFAVFSTILAVIFVGVFSILASKTSHAQVSGLVGYWNFDEGSGSTAADSSGSGNNGTLQNAPSWSGGKVGTGALSFSGTNQFVKMNNDPIDLNSVTVCAWVNSSPASGILTTIVSNARFFLFLENNGGNYYYVLNSNSSQNISVNSPANSATPGTWQHVCGVRNSDGTGSIYLNGSLSASGNTNTPVTSGGGMGIGSDQYGDYYWNGQMDDVRIYSHGLTAGEVSQVYTSSGGSGGSGGGTTYSLTVSNGGNGVVTSNPSGINCPGTCSASGITTGTSYTLNAVPVSGYNTSWSGCGGTTAGNSCSISVTANTTVTATFTASADTTPPSLSSVSAGSITSTGATITWTTNENSDSQVAYGTTAGYGSNSTLNASSVTSHSVTLSGLTANTLYHYQAKSKDASNNLGSSADGTFTTTAVQAADTTAPSVPTSLAVTSNTSGAVALSWSASTDPTVAGAVTSGLAGYTIYRGGGQIGTSNTTSYTDSTVQPSTNYSYTVAAYDSATPANTSTQSTPAVAVTTPAAAAPTGATIDPTRRITWTGNAGVPGGIPHRTTLCADVTASPYNADKTGVADAGTAINNAISHCNNSNGVVVIPAGTYNITTSINFPVGASNETVRGAGANSTILKLNGSGYIATQDVWIAPGTVGTAITSGSTKGSTSMVVSSVGSVSVGTLLYVTEDNDNSLMWSDTNGAGALRQVVRVTAVNAGTRTVTFDPPLVYSFNLNPTYTAFNVPTSNFIGLEDFMLDGTNTIGNSGGIGLVNFDNTYASWMKGVDMKGLEESGIWVNFSLRDEFRDNFFHAFNSRSTNESHGMLLYNADTGFLIENNIGTDLWSLVMSNNTLGSVIDYNYCYKNHAGPDQGAFFDTYQVACYNEHFGHGMMTLFEGNIGNMWQNDAYHGSVSHITLFRNWFSGLQGGETASRVMLQINQHGYYHNVVGNVLGDSSWAPGQYEMSGQQQVYNALPVIYRLGYPNMGNDGSCDPQPPYQWDNVGTGVNCGATTPTYPGQWMPGWIDDTHIVSGPFTFQGVKPTIFRAGNYDFIHNCTWDDVNNACLPSGQVSSLAVPNSLFYASKPAWWSTGIAWPPIGPDISGGNAASGHVNKIPAQVCFESQNLGGGGSFSAQTCYPNDYSGGSSPTTYTLSVSLAGTGSGSVSSAPSGITCGPPPAGGCSASFNNGTSVTLTAVASGGSTFTGWSGGTCSGTGTCVVNSAVSITATFTAPVDSTAPTVSITSPSNGSTVSGSNVSLAASATDNVGGSGIATVQFKVDGTNLGTALSIPTSGSTYSGGWDTTAGVSNGSHTLTAVATDVAGNPKTSTAVTVTVNNIVIGPDTTAPTVPVNLAATAVSSGQVNLTWSASTDPAGVNQVIAGMAGYKLFRNNSQITTISGTSYSDTNLQASTQYSYKILAYDAATPANNSAQSGAVTATTQVAQQSNAPSPSAGSPTGSLGSGTIQTTLSLATDIAATCKYGTTANTAYASIANTFSTTGGTSHSKVLTGLTDGTTYTYYVRCQSSQNVAMTNDYLISFSVANPVVVTPPNNGGGSGSSGGTGNFTPTVPQPTPVLGGGTGTSTPCVLTFATSTLAALPTFNPPLVYGMTSTNVVTLQSFLVAHNYLAKTSVTGFYGPLTQAAVLKYTTDRNTKIPVKTCPITLSPTTLSPSRLPKTFQFPTTLTTYTTNANVKNLQIFLNDHGFTVSLAGAGSKGNESTYYGPATIKALASFQAQNKIYPSVGNFGPLTKTFINTMIAGGK